jgi:ribosomal protein L35
MSLANLILRRQALSSTALLEAFDVLKSLTSRSIYDLSKPATTSTFHSFSTINASSLSTTTSVLPSLARLAPMAPTSSALPSIYNLWTSAQTSFFSLGGIRHASTVKVKPPFQGGKLKPYSAFKNRFKMTATGKIRYMRPGNVHKRHNKGRRQLQDLGETQVMQITYAKTMKRLGFVMRRF